MSVLFQSTITVIGPEVMDLLEGGVLILFRDGAPPELAEVSVLHSESVAADPAQAPGVGDELAIGPVSATITGIGDKAWAKVADLGHVVLSFNGQSAADRPGEICLDVVDSAALADVVASGSRITITRR